MQTSKFPHTPIRNSSISNNTIIFTALACLLVLILVIATVLIVGVLVKAPPVPTDQVVESVQETAEALVERTHFQEGYTMVLPTGFRQQSRDVSENGQIVYRFGSDDGCKFTFAIIPDESIDRFTIPPNDFSQTLVKGVRELDQDIGGEVDPVRVWVDGMTASLFRFYEKETFRGVNFTYCMVAMDRGRKLVLKLAGKYGRYSEREEVIEMPEHWYDALLTFSRDRRQEEPNATGEPRQ